MSLWSATADGGEGFGPLVADRSADVVVVGAGLAGLLTAHRLHRDGAEVVVLERGRVAGGVTANTTAKVTALHGTVYQQLRSGKGAEAAATYADALRAAVEDLADIASGLGIDCAFTRASAWAYAATEDGLRTVEAEVAAAQAAGLPARFAVPEELPFEVLGGVELAGQAHFQPVAFCHGVAAALPPGTIHEHTAVAGIDDEADGVAVRTEAGHRAHAGQVVLATHAPVVDPAFLAGRMRPSRSYAAAVEVTGGAVPDGMYLSVESPTRSLRPASRDGRPVLVAGGYGHPVGDADTAGRYEELERWVRSAFDVAVVTDRWSAHDQLTSDGVPFIGRLAPGATRRWVATGFGKWGMTASAVAAAVIADGIAGRANAWAGLVDATRLAPTLTRSLATASARVAGHYLGDRLQARTTSPDADRLAPGTGQVTRVDGRPAAVHRDDRGTVRTVSARCTHLGCLVRFNTAEQTWDCPCHGSRFAPDGHVIQGPATAPLTPLDDPAVPADPPQPD